MAKPFDNSNIHNGYRIDDRATFEALAPVDLIERASMYPGDLVMWDQHDDEDGWLLCHDDRNILVEDYILFVDVE